MGSGHVCLGWGQSSVCMPLCVCVMESMCVNSCPCADPAELQPASLVPTDPSCCLIAERKAITLEQHNTLAVSRRCLSSVPFSFLTIRGCRCHVYSGPASQIAHLKYTFICGYTHQLLNFVGWMQTTVLFFEVLSCILWDKTMFLSASLWLVIY